MITSSDRPPVKIIDREPEAKRLIDPMRREILRLLSKEPLTADGLSKVLGLSPPSVGHHLKSLKSGGLISVVRREAGSHGIIQKFYLGTAQAFIIDQQNLPLQLKRYFMPMDLERARGAVAYMALLKEDLPPPSSDSMEKLAHQFCRSIVKTAQTHERPLKDNDPEPIINRLYRDALREVMNQKV